MLVSRRVSSWQEHVLLFVWGSFQVYFVVFLKKIPENLRFFFQIVFFFNKVSGWSRRGHSEHKVLIWPKDIASHVAWVATRWVALSLWNVNVAMWNNSGDEKTQNKQTNTLSHPVFIPLKINQLTPFKDDHCYSIFQPSQRLERHFSCEKLP